MNEHRRQILQMLSEGKINADEAERLITAMEDRAAAGPSDPGLEPDGKARPKYLRVQVDSEDNGSSEGPTKVNVRVPMQLLRAGVRLASLIPKQAHDHLDEALNRHGVPLTLSQIKPENLEELVDHLDDLTVDVDGRDGNMTKVKVFCE